MERESRASAAASAGARRWETTPEDVIVVPTTGRPPRPPPSADGPPEKVYFKTKLCEKYVTMGRCMYEDACTFAHGQAELRPPLPLPAGVPWRRPSTEQEQHPRVVGRGKVCFMFRENGECHYGDKCAFPHASPPGHDMRNYGEKSAPPPPRAFPAVPGPSTRAFQPAVVTGGDQPPEENGGKVTRLKLLSMKKTRGIYGDWPEGL